MAKRPYRPTVKQVLVRDFNWRMGNLRRVLMNLTALDADLKRQAENLVWQQINLEKSRHEARLKDQLKDYLWAAAITEAEHARSYAQ